MYLDNRTLALLRKTNQLTTEIKKEIFYPKDETERSAIDSKMIVAQVQLEHILERIEWNIFVFQLYKREFKFMCLALLAYALFLIGLLHLIKIFILDLR